MKTQIKSGTVLLAEPFMMDTNFKRTAVLLVDHGEEGSIGFILNREVEMRVDELVED
ncbi:MAG: YqgE/AlgH family protein, partial [Bacteroidota bacterium]